jgi:hypothetical protein
VNIGVPFIEVPPRENGRNGGIRRFSITSCGQQQIPAMRIARTAVMWCQGATLLKYTGRRFAVYALEQNVTLVTKTCDSEHG